MAQTSADNKRTRIADYLRQRTAEGKNYFKSKFIADDLDLSSREVGTNLKMLAEQDGVDLDIKKHARSKSITWKVTRSQPSTPGRTQAAD